MRKASLSLSVLALLAMGCNAEKSKSTGESEVKGGGGMDVCTLYRKKEIIQCEGGDRSVSVNLDAYQGTDPSVDCTQGEYKPFIRVSIEFRQPDTDALIWADLPTSLLKYDSNDMPIVSEDLGNTGWINKQSSLGYLHTWLSKLDFKANGGNTEVSVKAFTRYYELEKGQAPYTDTPINFSLQCNN
jgi:hypothetical protein